MRRIKFTSALAATCLLTACATTGDGASEARGVSKYNDNIDYRKMAVITEEAMRRGHYIVWVNPPQKRARSN